jgi:hypothetical protein
MTARKRVATKSPPTTSRLRIGPVGDAVLIVLEMIVTHLNSSAGEPDLATPEMRAVARNLAGSNKLQALIEGSEDYVARVFAQERVSLSHESALAIGRRFLSDELDPSAMNLFLAAAIYLKRSEFPTNLAGRSEPTWATLGAGLDLVELMVLTGLHYEFDIRRSPAHATAKRVQAARNRIEQLARDIEAGAVRRDPKAVVDFRGLKGTRANLEMARKDIKAVSAAAAQPVPARARPKK